MEQLIKELQQNTAATRELVEGLRLQAQAVTTLAGAVHALADSLAACTTEASPEEERGDQAGAQPKYEYIDE